jgi:hypothetical protein
MYKIFKYSQHNLPFNNRKQLSFTNIVVTNFAKIYVASTYNILQSYRYVTAGKMSEGDQLLALGYIDQAFLKKGSKPLRQIVSLCVYKCNELL